MPVIGDPIQVPVGVTPVQIWAGISGAPPVFLANTDPANDIWAGYSQAITAGATNAADIPPFGTISMDGSRTIYASAAADGTGPLMIVPGGGNWSPSPVAIAAQMVSSGLAAAIAQAIAGTGISLLGAPQLLYNVTPAVTGGVPIGATTNIADYGVSSWLTAATTYNGYVGKPMATTFQRIYYVEGQWPPQVLPQIKQITAVYPNCKFQICVKPLRSMVASEQVNLANQIAILQRAGVVFDMVLWTEANIGNPPFFATAAAYSAYVQFYAPVIANPAAYYTLGGAAPTAVDLIYNPAAGANMATAVSYYPGDNAGGAAYTYKAVSVDYYGNGWKSGVLLDPIMAVADQAVPAKPFGISEWGMNAGNSAPLTQAQFYSPPPAAPNASYVGYLINLFQTRLGAGKTNYGLIYFNENRNPPNSADTVQSATDIKVPGIQALYNALSSLPAAAFTITAGATATATPISPSPGASYATAAGLSYDISLSLTANAAGSTNPFVTLTLAWYNTDSAAAAPVDTEVWSVPIGASGTAGTMITGKGPQRGQFLKITMKNNDTIACTAVMQVNSTGRSFERDDLRWDAPGSVAVPGFTLPGGQPSGNSLGAISASGVGFGTGISRLLSLYAGPVWIRFGQTGGTDANCGIVLAAQPPGVWGTATILNTSADKLSGGVMLNFPRAPVQVTLNNNASSGNMNLFAEFVSQD